MQRPRIRFAWLLPLLLSSAFAACADGDELSPVGVTPEDGTEEGGKGGGGEPGGAGAPSGLGGGGRTVGAGKAGAGLGGHGGADDGTGGETEGSLAGAGGSAGAGSPSEQLPLCARLSLKTTRATNQSRAFATAIYLDCNLSWLVPLDPNLDEYRQQLAIWNLEFWGCQGEPVTTLGLVWGTPRLSAGDVSRLIDAYLLATDAPTAELGLSPVEYEEMKSALERLAAPYIADGSAEPSKPRCSSGNGGAGGEATSAAGAGGEP